MQRTIHAIFNAHLDPVWMWPWSAGLDEALATCRSACDRLDAHPDLFFTQGEAWTFDMVRRADPDLFERIRRHVAAGRWEVVSGWWTQPDCNLPTAEGLARQIETGHDWVRAQFGLAPRCGFNPDSFGHCALLPEILRAHGQDRYVFMRPQEHERHLPARLFTWHSRPGGPAVTAFRIAGTYGNGTGADVWVDGVRLATTGLPEGVGHTMAFFGLGDHGGGPTERLVRWVQAHADIVPGWRLEFSTVNRFFDAVAADAPALPEVVGELQFHAVGCYTAMRAVKTAARRAEHALDRAAAVAAPDERPAIDAAWRTVCSHQFHDTLGGTGGPDVYPAVLDQLGGAAAVADDIAVYAVRRQMRELPDDPLPRLVLANPGADPFRGWCEAPVYLENEWKRMWRLVAPDGSEVPYQVLHAGMGIDPNWIWGVRRILFRAEIAANALLPLRFDVAQPPAIVIPRVRATPARLANDAGAAVELGAFDATLLHAGRPLAAGVAFHLIDDPSDTWTHGHDRYAEGPAVTPRWAAPELVYEGPLLGAVQQTGALGDSRLRAQWRVYADESAVDLLLDVNWRERRKLLKLVVPFAGGATTRVDGTPGLPLTRSNDGREQPLHDFTLCGGLGVVCPDCLALDATPARLRFTLLRAPLMAHHDPSPDFHPHAVVADQGVHVFRFRFRLGAADAASLAAEGRAWQRPPLVAELTRGMPVRMMERGR